MRESDFQREVINVAKQLGWRHYHTYDSRRSPAGFPDLVLVSSNHVLFAELKTDTGMLSKEQQGWIEALLNANATVVVWRPKDMERIVKVLTKLR